MNGPATGAYREANLGRVAGIDTYMTQNAPLHTTGDRTGTDAVDIVGQTYLLGHTWANAKDVSKSDTWHFINDVLRPSMAKRNGVIDADYKVRLGAVIGTNNKFVMVDAAGEYHIVNKRTGLLYKGAWFSNTYAWTAPAAVRVHANYPRVVQPIDADDVNADAFAEKFIHVAKKPKAKKAKKTADPKKSGPVKIWTLEEWNNAHPRTYME